MSLTKKLMGVATAAVMTLGIVGTAKTSSAQEHKVIEPPQYQHAPIVPGMDARDAKIFTEFEGIDSVIDSMYNYEYENEGYFRSPRLPWQDDVNTHMLWVPANGDGYLVQVIDFQGANDLYDTKGALALIDGPTFNEVGGVEKASPDGIVDYVIRIDEKGWYKTQEERIFNHLAKGEYHTFNLTENVTNQEGMNISRVMQHNYRAALTTLLAWAESDVKIEKDGSVDIDVHVYPRYFDYYFGPNSWCNPFYNYGFGCTTFWGPWIVPPRRWCPPIYYTPRRHIRPPQYNHNHKPKPIRRPHRRVKPVNPNRRDVISRIKPSATIDDDLRVRRTRPVVVDNNLVNRIRKPGAQPSGTYNVPKPTIRTSPNKPDYKPPARTRPAGTYKPRNNPASVIRPNTTRRPEYKPSSPSVRRVPGTRSPSTTYKPSSTYKPSAPQVRSAPSRRAPVVRRPSSSRSSAPRVRSAPKPSTRSAPRARSSRTSSSHKAPARKAPVRKAPTKPNTNKK